MDPVSIVSLVDASIGLALKCAGTVKNLNDIASKYNNAKLTVMSITSNLDAMQFTWDKIGAWTEAQSPSENTDDQNLLTRMARLLETGTLVMNALEDDLAPFCNEKLSFAQRARLVWDESSFADHQSRIRDQATSMGLLLQAMQLPSPKDRGQMIRKFEHQFQRSDESAYSIVPSRMSTSTWQTGGRESIRSEDDIVYRRLSFEDDLFTARVYKRNYRHPTLLSRSMNEARRAAHVAPVDGTALQALTRSIVNKHSRGAAGITQESTHVEVPVVINIPPPRASSHVDTAVVPSLTTTELYQADEISIRRFMIACESGDYASVQKALESSYGEFYRNDYCSSGVLSEGLHAAIALGYIEVVQILLKNGASIEDPSMSPSSHTFNKLTSTTAKDKRVLEGFPRLSLFELLDGSKSRPLHTAVLSKQASMVRIILASGADVRGENGYGEHPIHLAAKQGPTEILRLLINTGAAIDCSDSLGRRPLHLAASHPSRAKAIALLVHAGADIEAHTPSKPWERALYIACQKDFPENVHALLELGALATSPSPSFTSPLHTTISHASGAALEALLAYGVDPNWNGSSKTTALHLVIAAANKLLEPIRLLELLLRNRVDVNARDHKGDTALHYAARRKHDHLANGSLRLTARKMVAQVLKILLENGADPKTCNNLGHTPLFLAMQSRYYGMQSLLVDSDAELLPKERNLLRINLII